MRHLMSLNRYFLKYRRRLFGGVFFIVLSNLFAVYSPQVVAEAFDIVAAGLRSRDEPGTTVQIGVPGTLDLWVGWTGFDLKSQLAAIGRGTEVVSAVARVGLLLAVLYIVFALLKGLFMFYMRQTIIVMSRLIERDMKNEIFEQYQRLDRAFYKRNSTGDLMNRISEDVSKVRMYLGPAIMYTLNLIVLFLLCIGVMFRQNAELALYSLAPLPIMSVVIYYVSDIMNKRGMAVQQQQSHLSTLAQESFSGIRVLKAYVKERMVIDRFGKASREYRKRSLAQAKVDALFMPAIGLLIGLSTVVVIYIGGMKLVNGDPGVTVGTIAAFVLYVNMLTWPFASVGWVTSLVQQAAVSQERINEFLAVRPDIRDEPGQVTTMDFKGAIEFRNVSFRYPDTGIMALEHVSFSVPVGGTLAFVGHTGSGKSTVADLIGRQYDATTGEVLIDGMNIRSIPLQLLRKNLGFVPQDVFLFSDSIRNNVAFGSSGAGATDQTVQRAAGQAQVHENIQGFPKGYETLLGERGITLSGGQKQRVSIARAIAREPRILVFDDPLSAVDTATEEAILRGLKQVMKGRTTVIISHRISAVQDADHIIVLEHGRIAEQGRHGELLSSSGLYAALYQEQLLEEQRSA
ncbi:MAG: ABC transporter ATP-binding protein [Flavobacteriales bacterium]|nr:ABC transporter ATP-binding protein [Flavobacteriales bacterium]MBP6573445.1 ABC transporter ATP-binding protein [Flavobacteriales bacterium]